MELLPCRIFAQMELPDFIWISARILEIEEISLHTHKVQSVCSEERTGILALGWCPGLRARLLYFSLLVFYKESQRILPIWDVFQGDFCMVTKISGMMRNGSEARTV